MVHVVGCVPDDGAVVVVLSNRVVDDLSAELFFRPIEPLLDIDAVILAIEGESVAAPQDISLDHILADLIARRGR